MRIRIVLLALSLAAVPAWTALAAVPEQVSYQGLLTDVGGNPMAGPVNMEFEICDTPGGLPVWSETQNGVPLTNGIFDVMLGSVNPLTIDFTRPNYLLTKVDGNVIGSPRLMGASPYSLGTRSVQDGAAVRSLNTLTDEVRIVGGTNVTVSQAGDSITVSATGGGGPDSDWQIVGNDMYSLPSGRTGVGTATPSAKMHVYTQDQVGTSFRVEDGGSLGGTLGISVIDVVALGTRGRLQASESSSQQNFTMSTLDDGTNIQISAYEEIFLRPQNTTRLRMELDGRVSYLADDAVATVEIDPDHLTGQGEITVRNTDGDDAAYIRSDASGNGTLSLRNDLDFTGVSMNATNIAGDDGGGYIRLNNEAGTNRILLEGSEAGSTSDGAQLTMWNDAGIPTVYIDADLGGTDGSQLAMYNSLGILTIEMRGQEDTNPSNGSAIYLKDDTGTTTIELDADYGAGGEGRIITEVLEITGGADLSEQFDVAAGDTDLEPGMVLVIDPGQPGALAVSTRAYDDRVAGVVSGAGGVKPGMLMGQRGSAADGQHPVALTGRVYVMVDASVAPVEAGDLLTTSHVPGHAMKATDRSRAHGSILGKAMTSLESGRGLVLVLVALQ